MSEHRYPRRAVMADYARSGAGMALTFGPLLAVPATTVAALVLGGAGVLFAAFAGRTWLRQRTRVSMGEGGISACGLRTTTIAWHDVTAFDLRYYSTRRERTRGWMQMTLTGNGRRLRLESTLDGFARIAEAGARAATRNAVALSPSTIDNLRGLGIAPEGIAETPDATSSIKAGTP